MIKIDRDERRIGLSIKAAEYDENQLAAETAAFDSLGSNELTSLGDILDEATRDHCPPFGAYEGKCVVELRWPGVDKGLALGELKRRLGRAEAAVLAMGDDESDEATFASMSSRDLSVHVGPGPSGARACVPDPAAARALLQELLQRRRQGR